MALDSVSKLGQKIGGLSSGQEDIKDNLSPDSSDSLDSLGFAETIGVQGTLTTKRWDYSETSFILDHVVYGNLDSSVLNIDGGYNLISESDDCIIYLDFTEQPI
jgi:hypothetical protein